MIQAVSAGGIILREIGGELKIALAQHQRTTKTWVLPKGHVEPGETLEQAALREMYEETGVTSVQLIQHLGSFVRESLKSNGDLVQKTIHFYLAYAPHTTQAAHPSDGAFTTAGWFSPQEVLQLLPYDEERTFLKEHLALLFQEQGSN